ncbi:uncharacterized protein LOC129600466 isoform X2 [Paramacrobiotus metropolitanus]|uniref:uncharacterized protein LOC129600466 isoform X2 n=1 Tax=Paramacrobiotus metropolitanus TaxID=2943436 RepID=UPI002446462E|nr:uncharacterized protein LOC129600466 isoform X2 [Paramacrobiotus metropolitanus]
MELLPSGMLYSYSDLLSVIGYFLTWRIVWYYLRRCPEQLFVILACVYWIHRLPGCREAPENCTSPGLTGPMCRHEYSLCVTVMGMRKNAGKWELQVERICSDHDDMVDQDNALFRTFSRGDDMATVCTMSTLPVAQFGLGPDGTPLLRRRCVCASFFCNDNLWDDYWKMPFLPENPKLSDTPQFRPPGNYSLDKLKEIIANANNPLTTRAPTTTVLPSSTTTGTLPFSCYYCIGSELTCRNITQIAVCKPGIKTCISATGVRRQPSSGKWALSLDRYCSDEGDAAEDFADFHTLSKGAKMVCILLERDRETFGLGPDGRPLIDHRCICAEDKCNMPTWNQIMDGPSIPYKPVYTVNDTLHVQPPGNYSLEALEELNNDDKGNITTTPPGGNNHTVSGC